MLPSSSCSSSALTLGCLLSAWLLLCAPVAVRLSGPDNNKAGGHVIDNEADYISKIIEDEEKGLSLARQIMEGDETLSEEKVSAMVSGFGQDINSIVINEVGELIEGVKSDETRNPVRLDDDSLRRFNNAKEILTRDTQEKITVAGKESTGRLTQLSQLPHEGGAGREILAQVNGKLQSVGQLIGHQMSALSNLAPKIRGKIRSLPARLHELIQWPNFLEFRKKYNKVYKSIHEELYRQMVYLHTQSIAGVQNLKYLFGKATSLLKATEFADLIAKEYHKIFSNKLAETHENSQEIQKIDSATKQSLEELSKKRQNIFGQNMSEIIESYERDSKSGTTAADSFEATRDFDEAKRDLRQQLKLKRRRRSVDDDDEQEQQDGGDDEGDETLTSQPKTTNDEFEDEQMKKAASWLFGSNNELLLDLEDRDGGDQQGSESTIDDHASQFDHDADFSRIFELEGIIEDAISHDTFDYKPFDLRRTGCFVTPPNQEWCGTCYAHATMVSASYYTCMASGAGQKNLLKYSARFASDCGRYMTPLLNGCKGGRASQVINFTRKVGAHKFVVYELARVSKGMTNPLEDECAYPKPDDLTDWAPLKVEAFEHTYYAEIDISEIDLHLRTVGPVYVNLNVWDTFGLYGGGIFSEISDNGQTNLHTMLVVGHDRDFEGRLYWIVLNTHGVSWGDQGYLRISDEALRHYVVYAGGLLTREEILRAQARSTSEHQNAS